MGPKALEPQSSFKRQAVKRFVAHNEAWRVSLANNNQREKKTYLQLQRLLKEYDHRKWTYTRRIFVDSRATPHSHPILTLNTKYLRSNRLLLSTFLHEQIHWFASRHLNQVNLAIARLEQVFPKPPVRPPLGASGRFSTFLHLIVNYLEYQALKEIIGADGARRAVRSLQKTHYSWIYKMVLRREKEIGTVVRRCTLRIPER